MSSAPCAVCRVQGAATHAFPFTGATAAFWRLRHFSSFHLSLLSRPPVFFFFIIFSFSFLGNLLLCIQRVLTLPRPQGRQEPGWVGLCGALLGSTWRACAGWVGRANGQLSEVIMGPESTVLLLDFYVVYFFTVVTLMTHKAHVASLSIRLSSQAPRSVSRARSKRFPGPRINWAVRMSSTERVAPAQVPGSQKQSSRNPINSMF